LCATHDRGLHDVRPRRVVVLDEGFTRAIRTGLNDEAALAHMREAS